MAEECSSTSSGLSALRERQRIAWQLGDRLPVESLIQSLGRNLTDEELLELIYAEVLLRDQTSDGCNIDEYRQRFPQVAASLERLFEMHQNLDVSSPSADASLDATRVHDVTKSAGSNINAVAVGDRVGPYLLLKKLGEGGMGAVYQTRHLKLGKIVALKVLAPHLLARPDAVMRFEREMLAVGLVQHPNIVQALDAGAFDGVHYLSMEYVDGQDLQQIVKKSGPLSIGDACKAIWEAALGLAAAHRQGVVHRDIKPSNLMLTNSGLTKILDMGLAKLTDEAAQIAGDLTSTGQLLGTADYMAPEQWDEAHAVDGRTDQYSLGCTLFFLLSGRAPFATAELSTVARKMSAHLHSVPPDLIAIREEVPEGLNQIYRQLMSKEPGDRFRTTDELAVAVEPFTKVMESTPEIVSTDSSTEVVPVSTVQPTKRQRCAFVARHWRFVFISLGSVIALAGIGLIAMKRDQVWPREVEISDTRKDSRGSIPQISTVATQRSSEVVPEYALSFDEGAYVATPVMFDGADGLTIDVWVTWDHGGSATYIVTDRKGPDGKTLAVWEGRWCISGISDPLFSVREKESVVGFKRTHIAAVFDRDEIRLYVDGRLSAKGPQSKTVPSRMPFSMGIPLGLDGPKPSFTGLIHQVRFSANAVYSGDEFEPSRDLEPDANTIALYRMNEGTGTVLHDSSINAHHAAIHGAKWVDVSRNRLSGLLPRAQKLPDGRYWQLQTITPYSDTPISWHPDGTKIALKSHSTIRIHDAETFEPIRFHLGHTHNIADVRFSPDGKWLASSGWDSSVRLWNVESGKSGPVLRSHISGANSIAWSPDSTHLVSGGHWGDGKINVWNIDGTLEASWKGHQAHNLVLWSPDGKFIAAAGEGDTYKIWNPNGDPVVELRIPNARLVGGAFSPDGKWFMTSAGSYDAHYLARWETGTWVLADSWPDQKHLHWPNSMVWSHDNSKVYSVWQNANFWCWDVEQAKWTWSIPSLNMYSFALNSNDSRLLVNPTEWRFTVYDVLSRTPTGQFGFTGMNVSGDGSFRIASRPVSGGGAALNSRELRFFSSDGQQTSPSIPISPADCSAWSPDGRWLALPDSDFKVRFWDAEGNPGSILSGHTASITSLVWSPDGRSLVSASTDGTIRIWKGSGDFIPLVDAHGGGKMRRLAWSPKGNSLLVESSIAETSSLKIYSQDGALQRELPISDPIEHVSWHPSGEAIAICFMNSGRICLIDSNSGEFLFGLNSGEFRPFRLAWSPDGQWLGVSPRDGRDGVRLYSKAGKEGPTVPAASGSQICWLDNSNTFCIYGPDWIDACRLITTGERIDFEYLRSTRYRCDHVHLDLDIAHHRLYFWNVQSYWNGAIGLIQTVDLDTGKSPFSLLPLERGPTVRIDQSGKLNTEDPDVEKLFVYFVEELDGTTTLYKPAEFRKLVGW
ncbi:MAG TPA: protein kinase [Schlesneria sp.]